MMRSRRIFVSQSRVSSVPRPSRVTREQAAGISVTPGKYNASSQTHSRNNFPSPCLDRAQFTIAGGWTTTTLWISSFIRTDPRVARFWSFCKRTAFLISLFVRRFRARPLVHTYTSADHLTVKIGRDTSELQSQFHLVCRLLLEKKKKQKIINITYTVHYI